VEDYLYLFSSTAIAGQNAACLCVCGCWPGWHTS